MDIDERVNCIFMYEDLRWYDFVFLLCFFDCFVGHEIDDIPALIPF